jgi:hypothetical protein
MQKVGLTMRKIVKTSAVALSILINLPSATVAAEPMRIAAGATWTNVTPREVV